MAWASPSSVGGMTVDHPGDDQVAELGVFQGPVEEVGAHGEHHLHPAPLVGGDRDRLSRKSRRVSSAATAENSSSN